MSNSLDPDQARRIVGSDQGSNCLPRLSADNKEAGDLVTGFKSFYCSIQQITKAIISKNMYHHEKASSSQTRKKIHWKVGFTQISRVDFKLRKHAYVIFCNISRYAKMPM